MMAEPSIAVDIASRFDHVLVDEYQDTNRLQASILLALKPNGRGLTVVGDDAQSIYSFRAATVRNILDFPAHFDPRAEIVTLHAITDRRNRFLQQPAPLSIWLRNGSQRTCGPIVPRPSGHSL
jgi:superfamily I DNA/RNA helicase